MLSRRAMLTATFATGVAACAPKAPPSSTAPAPPTDDGATAPPAPMEVTRTIPRTRLSGRVVELGDMLDTLGKVSAAWSKEPEDKPKDFRAELDSMLLSLGAGPGLLAAIDLDGTHLGRVAYPHPGHATGPDDTRVAARVAAHDPGAILANLPATLRPEARGAGLWELMSEDVHLWFREQASALEVGASRADLDDATSLAMPEGAPDLRLLASAENLPKDDVDPSALFGLPPDSPLAKSLARVFQGLETAYLGADLGTGRDLRLHASAVAPFSELGLDPLGAPRAAPTALDRALPGAAVYATTMSWGSSDLVSRTLDEAVPLADIPPPFDVPAKKTLAAVHDLLATLRDDVALALYLDARGDATLVLAGTVNDAAVAGKDLRAILSATHEALSAQQDMVGDDPKAKMRLSYKPTGLSVAGGKAAILSVTTPKDARLEASPLAPFLDKGRLEVVSLVRGGLAAVVIGARGRKVATDLANRMQKTSSRASLADDAGLALARGVAGGCQICASVDVPGTARLILAMRRAETTDKAYAKQLGQAEGRLRKAKSLGKLGLSVRVTAKEGALDLVVSRDLLTPPRAQAQAVQAAIELADGPKPPAPKP